MTTAKQILKAADDAEKLVDNIYYKVDEEIATLKAENDRLKDACDKYSEAEMLLTRGAPELETENERLRKVLHGVVTLCDQIGYYGKQVEDARAALEGGK